MKIFLFKVILFLGLFLLLDRAGSLFLESQRPSDYKLFLKSKKDFFKEQDPKDILIFGDSHIADALDPRTLEDCSSLSSYNLGVYHASPLENYYLLKSVLEQQEQKPKTVILGTNPKMFERPLSKGKYTPLILGNNIPLSLNSEEGFDASFFLKTIQEKYLFKHLFGKLTGKEYQPTRKIVSVYNGHLEFYNQTGNLNWEDFEQEKKSLQIEKQVDYFSKMIAELLEQDTEVIIVNPSIWKGQINAMAHTESFKVFEKTLDAIALKYGIAIYNAKHQSLQEQLEKKDFLNTQHLNYYGSVKFTKHFCEYFSNTLN